jgi:hypothetical protein
MKNKSLEVTSSRKGGWTESSLARSEQPMADEENEGKNEWL